MQAVLFIGHGSRVEEAVRQSEAFIQSCKKLIDIPIQEHCFLELSKPTIEDGIFRCIEKGATRIAVVPVLLLAAGHAKHDIPAILENEQAKYPGITIRYGRPFGVHEAMIDILVERIKEKAATIKNDARILLVGRGSSDPDTKRDFHQIACLLQKKTNLSSVNTCYLAACEPSFESGLQKEVETGASQIFVVPYLLFTGVLMKSIEKQLRELETPNQTFILCNYLGYHEKLVNVLLDRVREILVHPQEWRWFEKENEESGVREILVHPPRWSKGGINR